MKKPGRMALPMRWEEIEWSPVPKKRLKKARSLHPVILDMVRAHAARLGRRIKGEDRRWARREASWQDRQNRKHARALTELIRKEARQQAWEEFCEKERMAAEEYITRVRAAFRESVGLAVTQAKCSGK